jgi:hypothetical protein
VHQLTDISLKGHVVLKHKWQAPGPGLVHIRPYVSTEAEVIGQLTLLERRAGKESVSHWLEREPNLELLNHVLLGFKVKIHLNCASPEHHV